MSGKKNDSSGNNSNGKDGLNNSHRNQKKIHIPSSDDSHLSDSKHYGQSIDCGEGKPYYSTKQKSK